MGTVLKSTGSWYLVQAEDGRGVHCTLKGKFRMQGSKATNPVSVGDVVEMSLNRNEDTGIITEIRPRNNYIVRRATKLSKRSHIIAANIDQATLIVTLALPRTSLGFIDRFLITCEAYHIPASIVFNKVDVYDDPMMAQMRRYKDIYEQAGYPCLEVSAKSGENLDRLILMLKDKITLLAGHSGVGKSTLINMIEPGLDLKTRPLSEMHRKGKHTTTFAEMFPLSSGGFIIDTPGIKEFGLYDFTPEEVAERYPEMRSRMQGCRYHNCTHIHEPGCAVKEAVEKGDIPYERYDNYIRIVNDDELLKKERR